MRILVLTIETRAEIQRVVIYAETNPVTFAQAYRTKAEPDLAVGMDERYRCVVPSGFCCVYSHEESPFGLCRHLSVSVDGEGQAPNPIAVEALMLEFGFRGSLRDMAAVWTEQIGENKFAVNVVQKL